MWQSFRCAKAASATRFSNSDGAARSRTISLKFCSLSERSCRTRAREKKDADTFVCRAFGSRPTRPLRRPDLKQVRILCDVFGDRVMLHQKLAQLLALGDLEEDRLVELFRREIHRPHEVLRAGRDAQLFLDALYRQHVELPRLPPVQQPQALLVELLIVEVDGAGHADILLHPGVLDGLRADAEQPLREIAE